MSVAKLDNKFLVNFVKQRLRLIMTAGIWMLAVYFLFYCSATRPTWEGLIDLLSNRNPPAWLIPSLPGEKVDVPQTKLFKRQKLIQFKLKANKVSQDFKDAVGIKTASSPDLALGNTPTWKKLKDDVAAAGNTFVEFWSISIVTYKGQTIVLGEGSQPINLNDRVLRWQKEIEVAANKYKLEPALIAAVIEQESGGDPNAVSPVGALGLMQLMPSTAKSLDVNPYDPAQNIDGGAHYLQIQLKEFGSVQAALAAYNAGPGNVERRTWVTIPETMNYVQRVPILIGKYERIWNEHSGINTQVPD